MASDSLLLLWVRLTLLYFPCSCILAQQLLALPASIPPFAHSIYDFFLCRLVQDSFIEPTLSSWPCARWWAFIVEM